MSVAIAVVLRPSKMYYFLVVLFAILLVLIGIYVGCLNHLSISNRSMFIVICGFAAWRSFLYAQRIARTTWQISIDGQGQVRCQPGDNNTLSLAAGTTLWSQVLFLRLHNQQKNCMFHLVVFPDALSKDEFRRLSVACKWIVARLN